jgi:type I site-specific restriction-modification system R (restriction) subunit
MYLDTLAGHNLMQAIERVNRVFGESQAALWWTFSGLGSAQDAVQTYTQAGGEGCSR